MKKKTHLIQNNSISTPEIVIEITNFHKIHDFLNPGAPGAPCGPPCVPHVAPLRAPRPLCGPPGPPLGPRAPPAGPPGPRTLCRVCRPDFGPGLVKKSPELAKIYNKLKTNFFILCTGRLAVE